MLAMISTKPAPIYFGWVVVEPPEVGSWVDCLSFADPPRRPFDQIEHAPSGIIQRGTGMAEGAADSVRPTLTATGREPAAPKYHRRPPEKIQTAGRNFERIEYARVAAAQKHAIEVEIQYWIGVRGHSTSTISVFRNSPLSRSSPRLTPRTASPSRLTACIGPTGLPPMSNGNPKSTR